MQTSPSFALVALLLAGCAGRPAPQGPDAGAGLAPGDHTFELRHDGRLRRYVVHVPPGGGADPSPVMLALHGGGGSGTQFKEDNRLDPVADRHRFLAVYPDGTGPLRGRLLTWNAGPTCCGYARDRDVDDVGFLVAVLDHLAERAAVDRGRIYVTGHSNGAMMTYRLAAERADLVAAMVPVGGAMALASLDPARPVPLLHIHSVDDPRALYHGGTGPPFPGTNNRVDHRAVMAGLEAWAAHNGCTTPPSTGAPRRGSGADRDQTVMLVEWSGCAAGGSVQHLRLTGVGHGWPGAPVRPGMRAVIGPGTALIDAGAEAWDFASRFRR